MRDDLLEDASHFERQAMLLIDVDVASGEGGLVEMPDQRLLAQRQGAEAVSGGCSATTAASSTRSRKGISRSAGAAGAAAGEACAAGQSPQAAVLNWSRYAPTATTDRASTAAAVNKRFRCGIAYRQPC